MYIRSEEFENDVYVSQRNSLNALDGDRVEFVITRRSHAGSLEGEITRIVERSRKQYVGTADVSDHAIFVKMDPRRMPMDVYLSKRDNPNVQHGDKVVIRITDWALGSKSPAGELVEVLGRAGENNTEMHAILAEYGLPYHFEQKVEDAAQAIPSTITKADYAARRDFRKITTFTIDPADAKDFDDALSIRKIEDGVWEVGVHIADVTHYVQPRSVIDTEAEERGTSVYLVDRTIPMLPEKLSNELCSLRPRRRESLLLGGLHAQRGSRSTGQMVRPHGHPLRPPLHLRGGAADHRNRQGRLRRRGADAQPSGPADAQNTLQARSRELPARRSQVQTRRRRQTPGRLFQ